ncbi:hypothetical protein L6270_04095 [Candidatus Parcubacteria bacterium]|nr:hypothetical protein [Patescibacteria group bacterium]MBU4309145.1 hypothetical protein [Patescibacteria group bacterium]MBU4432162.1 hypothetical protein [Patescibacteria group bacterium]MBU4577506.1 hypothetical protein [Patescibacteria group bacterium]MCG2697193.1 hypothetical protein [Candidatus Parcubacteria bacterium]
MHDERPQNDKIDLNKTENVIDKSIVTNEKVATIESKLKVSYSDAEKVAFYDWFLQIPENSINKPITVSTVDEVIEMLPKNANYTDEKINLFFSKENFLPSELHLILSSFAKLNNSFEISIVKHSDELISISIGNKSRNSGIIFSEEYFGHYHPTGFEFEKAKELPICFVAGLMPSSGDLKGYFKFPETIKNVTRIYSKNGFVEIKPVGEMKNKDQELDEFRDKYFDLFIGVNKLNIKSDDEVVEYFREKFGLELKFDYNI